MSDKVPGANVPILPAKFDPFMKSVPSEYYEQFDGSVESPTGWFGCLRVNSELQAEMGDFYDGEPAPEGFYFVQIDTLGIVWAFVVDPTEAGKMFDESVSQYNEYLGDDES